MWGSSKGVMSLSEQTLDAPAYVLRRVGERRLLVAGGGGTSNVGVPNFVETRLIVLDNDAKSGLTLKAPVVGKLKPGDAVMAADVLKDPHDPTHYLVAAAVDGAVFVWSTAGGVLTPNGERTFTTRAQALVDDQPVAAVCFIRRIEKTEGVLCTLAASTDDGSLHFFEFRIDDEGTVSGHLLAYVKDNRGIRCLKSNEAGSWMIVVRDSGHVGLWDTMSGEKPKESTVLPYPVTVEPGGPKPFARCAIFLPDAEDAMKLLVGYTIKGQGRLFKWSIGMTSGVCRVEASKDLGNDLISCLCLSECGRYVGVGALTGNARVLMAKSLYQRMQLPMHKLFVTALEFVKAGENEAEPLLVTTSADEELKAVRVSPPSLKPFIFLAFLAIFFFMLSALFLVAYMTDLLDKYLPF